MKSRKITPLKINKVHPHACTVESRLLMLRKVPFFKSISDSDLDRINRLFHHKSYQPDKIIYFSGDKASFLFVVISGNVRLVKHSADGKDVLIDILNPGDFLGTLEIFGEAGYKETAVAHTDACILSISNEDFRSVINKIPRIAVNLIEILSERLKSSNDMIQQLSIKSVEKRIAFILLKLNSRLGVEYEKGSLIQIPLSRNDLAEMTGSTPETASRVISSYAKAGIIKTGRKWISIIDSRKLADIAKI